MAVSNCTKSCPSCKLTKSTTEFYKNRSRRDGYCSICKSCNEIAKHTPAKHLPGECLIDDCSEPTKYRGYCRIHYGRLRVSGQLPLLKNRHRMVSSHPVYNIYKKAKRRCQNSNDPAYFQYGGRGIEFRFESFEAFINHIGERPSPEFTLDRFPDNNGHYEPGNVRWATMTQQNRNRRDNRILEFDGVRLSVAEWSERTNISKSTIFGRLRAEWCVQCVLTLPACSNGSTGGCPHRAPRKIGNHKSFTKEAK